jgi:hypothetical protein
MGGTMASDSALRLGMRGSMYGSDRYRSTAQTDSALGAQRHSAANASVDSLARVVATTDSLARAAATARSDSLAHGHTGTAPDSSGAKPPPAPGAVPPPAPPPIAPVPARPDSLP